MRTLINKHFNYMRWLLLICCTVLSACNFSVDQPAIEAPVASTDKKEIDKLEEKIRASSKKMIEFGETGNVGGYMNYVHPAIIEQLGGRAAARRLLEPMMRMFQNMDKNIEGKLSKIVVDNKRLVALMPTEVHFTFGGVKTIQKGYRIACSEDDGKKWTFLDGSNDKQAEMFKRLFPVFTDEVPLPKCSMTTK